jgi:hypothetical protein
MVVAWPLTYTLGIPLAWPFVHIKLEMQQAFGEHNHITPIHKCNKYSWLLVFTNPTNKEPSITNKISMA